MKLSIITINYNNAEGLKRTLKSVAAQTYRDIEHIIIDGGSTDGSVDIIKDYAEHNSLLSGRVGVGSHSVIWTSEKDNGIYNAMNKGIEIALGRRVVNALNRSELREDKNKELCDYCQFLNSGDYLAAPDVTERMINALESANSLNSNSLNDNVTDIIYGNMRKVMPDGKFVRDVCGATNDVTLNMFYRGCLNHSPAYIKRSLFDEYGLYDETLKICSDWKFYMQSIVLGEARVKYVDIDVTIFDMTGISETRKDILNEERNHLLHEMVPEGILKDYDRYHFPMEQYDRLKRHHLWGVVWFIERVLFKLEKWHILR